ncbi:MAG: 2-methylcitrate dehydratase [Verrucomicrobia bacterium]|nr:2-methylcitrate dehydratase [Verrucomicrobiota bacterium]
MNRLNFIKTGLTAGAAYSLLRLPALAAETPATPALRGTTSGTADNVRPPPDSVMVDIAEYALNYKITSDEAYSTAHYDLIDTLGGGIAALSFKACTKLFGPVVPGTIVPNGSKVPGTSYQLDPINAAFHIGAMNRWLDYNDAWLAAEWGHPSDNLGGILATADWLSRTAVAAGKPPLVMHDVLTAMIKAHEIQGIISNETSFNQVGIDHVTLVRVASTAVVSQLLGLSRDQTINALSHAWADGGILRVYRHSPNVGSRKSWAAGDATSRAVRLALMARTGEMGIPSVLTAKEWGFYDVLFKGKPFTINQPYGSYVMENVLFKISYPAGFHIQTAAEAAIKIYPQVKDRLNDIKKITIRTHESTMRYLVKRGPLNNPADRDHSLQYIVAVALIKGDLVAEDYEDDVARDPRIDALREKMFPVEDKQYTKDYYDPAKRSNPNAILVEFNDGTKLPEVVVEYPLGHRRRRQEALPQIIDKFKENIAKHYSAGQQQRILDASIDRARLEAMPVHTYVDTYVV